MSTKTPPPVPEDDEPVTFELRDVDPLDPEAMRRVMPTLDTSAPELLTINVGRPSDEEFIRVHPDAEFSMMNNVLVFGRTTYIVAPAMVPECGQRVRQAILITYFGQYSGPGIWPVNRPRGGGGESFGSSWATSAMELAARARQGWVRLESNQAASRYDCISALSDMGEPAWPNLSYRDLLKLAFGNGGVIDHRDHPTLKALRGET
jgi:hypothetical protein